LENILVSGGIAMNTSTQLNCEIVSVREEKEYLDRAVDYFSSKWGIDRRIYNDCISNSSSTPSLLPRWYLINCIYAQIILDITKNTDGHLLGQVTIPGERNQGYMNSNCLTEIV